MCFFILIILTFFHKNFGYAILDNTEILVGIFPDESGKYINDLSFRFC